MKGDPKFPDTHWSVVVAAGSGLDDALAQLCAIYWIPLYAFARQRGHSIADAQDAVQSFLADFIERNDFARATPERGRFRAYLLTAFRHALANDRRHANAAKRGGGREPEQTWELAEAHFQRQADPAATPEALFDRQWALTVLERGAERLASSYARKPALYQELRPFLDREDQSSGYTQVAEQLGMSVGAVKVAVHRMRQRYGELLRREVAATIANPADVDAELRELMRVFL